ncbi:MAG: large conductance mechanosensitive channel protein MscL [Chloroflexota bacterium]
MIREFRDFILRGNVLDLAVGIVIGAAFTAIVNSLVADLLTPFIGIIFSTDFSALTLTIRDSTITYGNFLNALISFLLIAAALFFFVVKPMNALAARRAAGEPAEDPSTKICPQCASAIPVAARRCPMCTSQLPA